MILGQLIRKIATEVNKVQAFLLGFLMRFRGKMNAVAIHMVQMNKAIQVQSFLRAEPPFSNSRISLFHARPHYKADIMQLNVGTRRCAANIN